MESDSFSRSCQESIFAVRYRHLLKRMRRGRWDLITPLCLLMLWIVGVFFIYSAQLWSAKANPELSPLWVQQVIWGVIGIGVYVTVSLIPYKFFFEQAHWVYGISIGLLGLLWTPLGQVRYDALRWLDLGLFSLQPAEIAKIGTLVFVCSILARSEVHWKVCVQVSLVILLPMALIFIQPDLGSILIFPPMALALLYVYQFPKKFFIAAFVVFLMIVGTLVLDSFQYQRFLKTNQMSALESKGEYETRSWLPLKNYQRNRILAFVAPELIDPQGTNETWNSRQSLISVGSGGWSGKGWTQGTQAKLGYLPQSVAHNDFIFSVLAEEKGFLGGIGIIGLYTLIIINGIRIAGMTRDRFGVLLAVGVSVIFMIHIFVNIGMTIGLVPITGLPLPFLSYGGSFLLSCCSLQGMVQSVYRFRKDFL